MEFAYSNVLRNCKYHSLLTKIAIALRRCEDIADVFVVRNARVPIVKCRHIPTNTSIDFNIMCSSSVQNSLFVRDLLNFDRRLRQFVTFIKIWAKETTIISKANIASYGVIMLVIFYLQNTTDPETNEKLVASIEKLQSNEQPRYEQCANFAYDFHKHMQPWSKSINVKELIKGFFAFYKNFDFDKNILSPYLGKTIRIEEFLTENFQFPAYEEQRNLMRRVNGEEPDELLVSMVKN